MRRAFVETLVELAESDERIVLMSGDLGYTVIEPFAQSFPARFFNAGVAEQNLVGMASGLAEAGYLPFVYSIAPFATLRPYEFIRNGPILQQLPVRIVGVGGGLEYGHNGPSHYALEDVGVLRIHPGMTVLAPADYQQAQSALRATYDCDGPVYYRLGKDDSAVVLGLEGRFEQGKAHVVLEGSDMLFVAMGAIATEAVEAATRLTAEGVSAGVMVVSSVNPPPREDLEAALARVSDVVTVESHYVDGGVGSLVAEVVAEAGLDCRLRRCGVRTSRHGTTGSEGHLNERHGISAGMLVATVMEELLPAS
ncbi:MAG: transketolase family protein [Gaiellaceae bacterium]